MSNFETPNNAPSPSSTSAWERVMSNAPQNSRAPQNANYVPSQNTPQSPERTATPEKTESPAGDRYRQTCKLVAAFAYGRNGEANLDAIFAPRVNPPTEAWDEVLDGLAHHEYDHEKRQILKEIASPLSSPNGVARTMDRLSDKHERRILGYMTGGANGFHNYDRLDGAALIDFTRTFPTPMDFEEASASFVKMIGDNNGAKRQFEYAAAMNDFKHKVYGKRQEYWERMQELEAFAQEHQSVQDHYNHQPRHARPSETAAIPRTEKPEAPEQRPNSGAIAYARAPEQARSYEWAPGAHAAFQVSKAQVRRGEAQPDRLHPKMLADNTCEDAFLVDESIQLYGVFDGAGGHGGGRAAAETALEGVLNCGLTTHVAKEGEDLAFALDMASIEVYANEGAGYSTGVLAKPCEIDGQKFLIYASVGDSRIYVVNKSGETKLITKDEGEGNRITNCLGLPPPRDSSGNIVMQSGRVGIVKQFGRIPVEPGDRVVLCSDGITGDFEPDFMSNEEIGTIVRSAMTPEDAALDLVGSARKTDDRTAVVFQI